MRTLGVNPNDDIDYLADRMDSGLVGFSIVGDDAGNLAFCGYCDAQHEVPGLCMKRYTVESPTIAVSIPILGRNWEIWICDKYKLDPACLKALELDDIIVVDGRLRTKRGVQ